MAVKRTGLGKGLDSMIPPKATQRAVKEDKNTVSKTGETILKINEVEPNKKQPRKFFNEEALQELSDSIKQHGIVQPLVVAKKDDYFEIIAGERRWRAAKLAGLKEVPVVIKDYSPQEIMEVALIEPPIRSPLGVFGRCFRRNASSALMAFPMMTTGCTSHAGSPNIQSSIKPPSIATMILMPFPPHNKPF